MIAWFNLIKSERPSIINRVPGLRSGIIGLILTVGLCPVTGGERVEWFPRGNYFQPILLDPATPQLGSSVYSRIEKGVIMREAYIPVNMGTSLIVVRKPFSETDGLEAGFEFAIHSQFIIGPVRNMIMGGLQNTDYRISGITHYKKGKYVLRAKLFHQSSHLGDDHIIRNGITTATSNIQNYEEVSLMVSTVRNNLRYYFSGGYNISIYTVRERIMVQGGFSFVQPLGTSGIIGMVGGCDLKIYQQNSFSPNWKTGLGFEIRQDGSSILTVLVEYYNGHLPYSTLEPDKVQLLGMGFYFNPRWTGQN